MSKSTRKPKPASVKIEDESLWKRFSERCDQKGLLYKKAVEKALEYYLEAGMPN